MLKFKRVQYDVEFHKLFVLILLFQGLCSLYLLENVHPTWKHCVVSFNKQDTLYFLSDQCSTDLRYMYTDIEPGPENEGCS